MSSATPSSPVPLTHRSPTHTAGVYKPRPVSFAARAGCSMTLISSNATPERDMNSFIRRHDEQPGRQYTSTVAALDVIAGSPI